MSVKQFRLFLTLSWSLNILSIIIWLWTDQFLPPLLQEYLSRQDSQEITATDIILTIVGLLLLLSVVISYIGLYLWKDWARHLFLITTIIGYLMALIDTAPSVMSSWAFYINDLATLFTGMVLAIIYYNEIRQRFTATSIPA